MERKVIVVCALVAVLGIISAAAGFAAEATKVKVSEVYIVGYSCVYPSSPALGLGIAAAAFAILARIVIIISVGCCSCCQSDSTSSAFSRLFNILSWIATAIAVVLLLAAAALNNREIGQKDSYGTIKCYVIKPGIFATGAVLSLLSAFFGIVAYVSVSSAMLTTTNTNVALPVASNVDLEKSPVPPQQMPPGQYPPQQNPQQQYR